MFRKHCSDEQLLSYLDGELTPWKECAVKKHLRLCWSCRRRAGDLEETIRGVSAVLDRQDYPSPQWIVETKLRIAAGTRQIDRELVAASKPGVLLGVSGRSLPSASVGLALMLLMFGAWYLSSKPTIPEATEVIALVEGAEAKIYQQSVRQVFSVEFNQIKPRSRQISSRLQIVSDPKGKQSVTRWIGPTGTLRHAVYRPAQSKGYIYDAGVAPQAVREASRVAKLTSVVDLNQNGMAVEQLETGFMRWLESRDWQPLSLTRELASFADREGVVLILERAGIRDGGEVLRLSARRAGQDLSVEFLMEVDPQTHRPRVHEIRFETPHEVVHLRVVVEEFESIPAAALPPSIFEPEFPHYGMVRSPVSRRPPTPARAIVSGLEPAPLPGEAHLEAAEIEVRHALHHMAACLGEPIEVVRNETGGLTAQGVVSTAERKSELTAALDDLDALPWFTHDLRTVEEAVESLDRSGDAHQKADDAGVDSSFEAVDGVNEQITGDRLPLRNWLETYFHDHGGDPAQSQDDPGARVRAYAEEVVTLSGEAWAHAWSLRRLVEQYPPGSAASRSKRSQALIDVMFRDHLSALQASMGRLRRLFQSVLVGTDPPAIGARTSHQAVSEGDPESAVTSPVVGILEVFTGVEQVRNQVLLLFASSRPRADTRDSPTSGPATADSAAESAEALLEIMANVEALARRFGSSRLRLRHTVGSDVDPATEGGGSLAGTSHSLIGR